MLEQLPLARRADAVRALGEDGALGLDRRGPARRALLRRRGRLRAALALDRVRRRRDDLRDHVARAQHDHLVARADVLAGDVLLVVQRRQLHGDAADADGLEHRERVQVAELADVPHDVVQQRDLGGRRELPGDRPARVAPDDAQAPLQLDVVDLHDDAVDLEVQAAAALLPAQALRDDLVLAVELDDVAVHAEAVVAQPVQALGVAGEAHALGLADAVAPHRQRALRRRAWGRAGGSCPPPRCGGS